MTTRHLARFVLASAAAVSLGAALLAPQVAVAAKGNGEKGGPEVNAGTVSLAASSYVGLGTGGAVALRVEGAALKGKALGKLQGFNLGGSITGSHLTFNHFIDNNNFLGVHFTMALIGTPKAALHFEKHGSLGLVVMEPQTAAEVVPVPVPMIGGGLRYEKPGKPLMARAGAQLGGFVGGLYIGAGYAF